MRSKIQEVLQTYKGQRFINSYPEEITISAKFIYLCFTTILGSKTLGEEYTDLIYVNRNGKRLPRLYQRVGFVASYLLIPYFVSKFLNKLVIKRDDTNEKIQYSKSAQWLASVSFKDVLDSMMNLHIALFYLHGKFYQFSKRFFGLRYAFGHQVNESQANGSYEVLGTLIIIQFLFKMINKLNEFGPDDLESDDTDEELARSGNFSQVLYGAHNKKNDELVGEIDLSNPRSLPFIAENSRKCMLCLEYMKAPSLAPCGHCFCWKCITDWHKERPECPLCRQLFHEQEIVSLR